MAGIRQFDQDAVVERAMMTFWQLGYGATSIHNLERATKLRRGSIYNAYGDKQGLFIAALERYQETIGQERFKHLSHRDPYLAIKHFLTALVDQMSDHRRPRGCLHTNTSLEFPGAPDAVLRMIAEHTSNVENTIYAVLQRAKKNGSLGPAADTRALARFYLAVAKGIGVLHKIYGDPLMLRDIVDVAMRAWPTPAGKKTRRKAA
jgi:AcrR family transcriptional regulator